MSRHSKVDVVAARKRAEAATAGEWRVSSTGYSVKSASDDMPIVASCPGGAAMPKDKIETWLENAEFIAAARTDVPLLCDEVERLRKALRQVARGDYDGDPMRPTPEDIARNSLRGDP